MRGSWRTVARREIHVRITDRAFVIGTVSMTVLIIGFIVLQALLGGRTSTYDVVASDARAAQMTEAIRDLAPSLTDNVKVKAMTADTDDAARQAVEDGRADAWLTPTSDGWRLLSKDEVPSRLERVAEDAIRYEVLKQNASRAGTSVEELSRGTAVTTDVLHGDLKERQLTTALAFVFAILFYMSSIMFGMTLGGSVVEEKQSRIVEIIATKIPIRHLLAGKILGNTVLALGQTLLYVIVGIIGLQFTDYGSFLGDVTGGIVWFLAFFLVGFLLLACLWAVVGALSPRTEDMQNAATPLTILLVVMFFVALIVSGTWATILSYVPPFSAILMPMRAVRGTAEWWEPVLSLGILAVSAVVVVAIAERLYRRALLQNQGRISWRQAWTTRE